MSICRICSVCSILKLVGLDIAHWHARVVVRDGDIALPEPVPGPNKVHLLNWNALRLRDEEEGEELHDHHPGGEEQEDAPLHGAQHGQEALCDQEREEQVGGDGDTLPGGACLQRVDFAWY